MYVCSCCTLFHLVDCLRVLTDSVEIVPPVMPTLVPWSLGVTRVIHQSMLKHIGLVLHTSLSKLRAGQVLFNLPELKEIMQR